ncbi:MAG: hypothetical protein J6M95_03385 [Bacilli bacterium]|nr:hypothetical protein [Bacilli bacterium]
MTRRKPKIINQTRIKNAIDSLPNPMYDKKHDLTIYIVGKARSNQSRVDHIAEYGHDLKVRDIESIPNELNNYLLFKKNSAYKSTFNYYLKRKGKSKGLIKVSIRISEVNPRIAWIKTIFITYNIK